MGIDENRQRVIERKSLGSIIRLIYEDHSLASIWIPVLYNVCVDYGKPSFFQGVLSADAVREPAQKHAVEAACLPALIEVFQKDLCRSNALLNYACLLLESVVASCKAARDIF